MWIIRFHLLETKHYNKISRIYKKYDFVPRKISSLVFAKACILHHTQKTSWRALGRQFWADHTALYRFDDFAMKSGMLWEIFHVFSGAKVALFIGNNKTVDIDTLGNSDEISVLTHNEFESMLLRM